MVRRISIHSVLTLIAVIIVAAAAGDAGAQTCGAAAVWASPQVVQYRTVIKGTREHRLESSFALFIEPADGSAADIDPDSIELNGLPVSPESSVVGDEDENGVPDLKVKLDRSALITTDGFLSVTGRTRSGGCFAGETSVEILCLPSGVERSDYFIEFTTGETRSMPDPNLNGLPARLDVRRVKPVFPQGCPNVSPVRTLVLAHGRTLPARSVFDLQYKDYSLMEALAMRGVDTFAVNQLGHGFSSLPAGSNPLDDPCNASLPECTVDSAGNCTPQAGEIPGETCDCQGLPRNQKINQQGSTRYLNPNPLAAPCGHTSSVNFQTVLDQVDQLALVVDDALAKTGHAKAHLLGLSFGGPVVGKYLGDDVSRQDKVAGAIFLASTFGGAQTREQARTTFPLGVIDQTDQMGNFNLAGPTCRAGDGCVSGCTPADPDCAKGLLGCPGQQDPEVPDALWAAVQEDDPTGRAWGPQPGGLSRYPIVPRFEWNAAVTQRIRVPVLAMNGLKDLTVRVAASPEIWSSSPLQEPETVCTSDAQCAEGYACKPFPAPARCRLDNRTLVQLDCASHVLHLEDCAGEGCLPPHLNVQKRVGDFVLTTGPMHRRVRRLIR